MSPKSAAPSTIVTRHLSIAAVVSLALGLFQDFGTPQPAGEPPVDWVEGVAIMIAVLIVVESDVPQVRSSLNHH
ncbi:hypothetical protein EV702DRAFT_1202151 [Suillus placidus]|uniref:Uncharacterized protein n=1 Tax=Suillus placidus TaxID=48579 RepID=A0A9P6ZN98_9AGAM|nr:hypothetical protein EV702DRAFT_1202151 [Suillus placidus]